MTEAPMICLVHLSLTLNSVYIFLVLTYSRATLSRQYSYSRLKSITLFTIGFHLEDEVFIYVFLLIGL